MNMYVVGIFGFINESLYLSKLQSVVTIIGSSKITIHYYFSKGVCANQIKYFLCRAASCSTLTETMVVFSQLLANDVRVELASHYQKIITQ